MLPDSLDGGKLLNLTALLQHGAAPVQGPYGHRDIRLYQWVSIKRKILMRSGSLAAQGNAKVRPIVVLDLVLLLQRLAGVHVDEGTDAQARWDDVPDDVKEAEEAAWNAALARAAHIRAAWIIRLH